MAPPGSSSRYLRGLHAAPVFKSTTSREPSETLTYQRTARIPTSWAIDILPVGLLDDTGSSFLRRFGFTRQAIFTPGAARCKYGQVGMERSRIGTVAHADAEQKGLSVDAAHRIR